jgi:alkaline phosphatase/alkaline phosphatase D
VAKTVPQLRQCWHEQFRFPRMIEFFRRVPAYWSKDDHDFRYNESDNTTDELPSSKTGIDMFREQLPLLATGSDKPSYRTHRVSKDLQIWLTEGRDYRSPNEMPDGPEKSLWGAEQRDWLKTTLKASDARWKILISPTPMVGPDDLKKIDNHADISGFRHEADAFFAWLKESQIDILTLVCGDRHWQYHSIHPSGIHEFACGALNDENARMGVAPGAKKGSDPQALVKQPYTSATPKGGFLQISAGDELLLEHFDPRGELQNRVRR